MSRNLVIYYSRKGQNYVGGKVIELERGNSEIIAEMISEAADADIFEIIPAKEYPEEYAKCTEVAKEEIRRNARPRLKEYLKDLDGYDNIIVVGPCWWGTYPMPVFSQLEELSFKGRKVFPVMTHEGSGLGSCERDLKSACRGGKVKKGLAIQGSKVSEAQAAVEDWVRRNVR